MIRTFRSFLYFFCGLTILHVSVLVAAPNTIRLQGRLTDNAGAPIPGNDARIKVAFFTVPVGGSSVWETPTELSVATNDAGLFATDIGPIPPSIFSNNEDLYFELRVRTTAGLTPLSPRQKFSTVPFAARAESAVTSDTALRVADNAVSSTQIVDGSVSSSDLAAGAVTDVVLATGVVKTIHLAIDAVTDAKVHDVGASKIVGKINSSQIQSLEAAKLTGLAGVIVAYGGTTAPDGWLLCDGSTVGRTQYPALFNAIGTNFGAGNGTTSFTLPDLRGRFLRGRDAGVGRDPAASSRSSMASGGAVGDTVGSVQSSEVGSHSHSITDPGHAHSMDQPGSAGVVAVTVGGPSEGISGGGYDGGSFRIRSTLSATTRIVVNPSSGQESRPVNAYVNYIIKY